MKAHRIPESLEIEKAKSSTGSDVNDVFTPQYSSTSSFTQDFPSPKEEVNEHSDLRSNTATATPEEQCSGGQSSKAKSQGDNEAVVKALQQEASNIADAISALQLLAKANADKIEAFVERGARQQKEKAAEIEEVKELRASALMDRIKVKGNNEIHRYILQKYPPYQKRSEQESAYEQEDGLRSELQDVVHFLIERNRAQHQYEKIVDTISGTIFEEIERYLMIQACEVAYFVAYSGTGQYDGLKARVAKAERQKK